MIDDVDANQNGFIDFEEFCKMLAEIPEQAYNEDVMAAFKVFDIDGDGIITREEAMTTFRNLGEDLTEEKLEALMTQLDTDNDGTINYAEFAKLNAA